ncbi:MAG: MBL fold metallo-hydrolase [Lentimicrobiaceae bacterium]|jgi:glyoxylase-like metal-dependent hydrolase (beta-lactamase superfamily II)|nr:MBL fold metallo-hydrolase [Lentimicrobiaceae bacterium]MCP4909390.1 MBL fold metallo-hydrolase [Bacteroidota bacterium]MBT3454385.1 MBL fold metallo-hydrolase [Lentimicrobiaceae bacterium]MBT3818349.1 MBL fold metallo-hydrolase [Lentimicrobiaceae bacterium]MBT4061373.1 MBL fold metallo-hydrolase [Lentimicrobiaceae bacterium]
MIKLKRFTFNAFQENTYVLWDETNQCIIIDPGMQDNREETELVDFIESNELKPVKIVLTHAHIDHILGCWFTAKKFNIDLYAHKDAVQFVVNSTRDGAVFGIQMGKTKGIDHFIDENDGVEFGNSKLKVFLTPGHADGSLCFYASDESFVITGDVLFNQSIGRTDLPTGSYELLQKSIWEKLFTLPDETVAYPGHGPETTIGSEKVSNPFVAIGT